MEIKLSFAIQDLHWQPRRTLINNDINIENRRGWALSIQIFADEFKWAKFKTYEKVKSFCLKSCKRGLSSNLFLNLMQ